MQENTDQKNFKYVHFLVSVDWLFIFLYQDLIVYNSEVYSEFCQTSKMECFSKTVNAF